MRPHAGYRAVGGAVALVLEFNVTLCNIARRWSTFLLAAMVGESNYESTTEGCYGGGAQRFLSFEFLVAFYFVQNTNCEMFESSPGFLSQYARDISGINLQTGMDAVMLFLAHLDVLIAPEPDKISRKKSNPSVQGLHSSQSGRILAQIGTYFLFTQKLTGYTFALGGNSEHLPPRIHSLAFLG